MTNFETKKANLIEALLDLGWTDNQIIDMLVKEYGASSYPEWSLALKQVRSK